MGYYPDDFLEQLKSKVDIVDLISSYANVQKKGRDYWACCPFHNEKTPSFQIKRDQQYYHCYGCGKNGNIFKFIMDYENVSFSEAVEVLAKRAGLEVPEPVEDAGKKRERELREKILNINKESARFYYDNLLKPEGAPALQYYASRGLSTETIKKFGMGYSCDFDSLPKYLLSIGYDKSTLLASGMVFLNQRNELADFFGGRITIPIINAAGKIIGFTARTLIEKPNFAKYKNTTTTPVFKKGMNLFGINLYKKYRQNSPRALILVEGHMDVISLYQAGLKNAVASMGTMLSIEQCREIKRYADIVYVSYDGDSAGQKATIRGLDMLKQQGLEVKVVCLTDDLDPDDYVRKYGKDAYVKLLDEALPLEEYKLKSIESGLDFNNNEDRIKYAKSAMEFLAGMDEVERSVYVQTVSEKSKLDIGTLMQNGGLNALPSNNTENVPKEDNKTEVKTIDSDLQAEIYVVSAFVYGKSFIDLKKIPFIREILSNEDLIKIFDYYWESLQKDKNPVIGDLYNVTENGDIINEVIGAVEKIHISEQEDYFYGCIKKLINVKKSKELSKLTTDLLNEEDITGKEKIREQIKLWLNFQAKF